MKISVIVLAYNLEQYIIKCLQSLANQTYKNLEVIVVNDGSTDGTQQLIESFCKDYPNFIVINKENGGQSIARNLGIKTATGDYIGFVDGDDFIKEDMFELLATNAVKESADISICGKFKLENSIATRMFAKDLYVKMTNTEALKMMLEGNVFQNEPWDKIYRKTLFDDILFPAGKQYEDSFVMFKLLSKSNVVIYDSTPKYYYLIRDTSTTGVSFNPKRMWYLEAGQECLVYVAEHHNELLEYALFRYLSICLFLARDIIKTDEKAFQRELSYIRSEIKRYDSQIIGSTLYTKKQRLQLKIIHLSLPLFKLFVKGYGRLG